MISHVHIGIKNFEQALSFYSVIMSELGFSLRFSEPENEWAGWNGSTSRPLFLIGKPFNKSEAHPGNGQMVALLASSRDLVDRVHAKALSIGGTDEGSPGLRPNYHANYYGAYFRDLDGNKICICCHDALI